MAEKVQVNADKLKVLNAVMEKIEKDRSEEHTSELQSL